MTAPYDRIVARFPDGYRMTFDPLTADQLVTIRHACLRALCQVNGQWISHAKLTGKVRVMTGRGGTTEGTVTRRCRELREDRHGGHIVEMELGMVRIIPAGSERWSVAKTAEQAAEAEAAKADDTLALEELEDWRRKWAHVLGGPETSDRIVSLAGRILREAQRPTVDPGQMSLDSYDETGEPV